MNAPESVRAEADLQRFLSFISPEPNTGCWLWTATTCAGYGHFKTCRNGIERDHPAHRWLYELLFGPVDPALHLDHEKCDQRSCCNPAHLVPKTPRANILRGRGLGAKNARKTHCARASHPLSGDNLRIDAGPRRRCRACELDASRRSRRLPAPQTAGVGR